MRHHFLNFDSTDHEPASHDRDVAWRFHRHGRGGRFGFGGFGGSWRGTTKRGDMKFIVLEALAQGPRHGYDIMADIEERYEFRPSAGSIYPTLQMLEDAGHVTSSQDDGKRVYTISASGRELLEKRPVVHGDAGCADPRRRVMIAAKGLMMAVMGAHGTEEATLDKVARILETARKEVYSILSSDPD